MVVLGQTPEPEQRFTVLPVGCVHCGDPALKVNELAPWERQAAVWLDAGLCARHWSNFAQGLALSHGLSLLRSEESDSLSD